MSCLVFWGSALVLLLAKWINLGNQETQDLWVEICEQILNGVCFAVVDALGCQISLQYYRPVLSHWDWPHPLACRRHISFVSTSMTSPYFANFG